MASVYDTLDVDETKRVWFSYGDSRFECSHLDASSVSFQKIMNAKAKPLRRVIAAGLLSPEKNRTIAIEVFVEACLHNWEHKGRDGNPIPFSRDAATQLFTELPKLYTALAEDCSDMASFRATEEDAKN